MSLYILTVPVDFISMYVLCSNDLFSTSTCIETAYLRTYRDYLTSRIVKREVLHFR
jgi:hypothetical protein